MPDEIAIERIRAFAPHDGKPYCLAYSGGKDSTVILDLARRAGVPYEAHYSFVTIDPPELHRFILDNPEIHIDRGPSLWESIKRHHTLPTRWCRFCCQEMKERGGKGQTTITGVRWSESKQRSTRPMFRICPRRGGNILNPIIDWTTYDVWSYIRTRNLPVCSLYADGWKRLGCILCPMASVAVRRRQAARWPRVAAAWRRAADRLWEAHPERQKLHPSPDAQWHWWMSEQRGKPSQDPLLFE